MAIYDCIPDENGQPQYVKVSAAEVARRKAEADAFEASYERQKQNAVNAFNEAMDQAKVLLMTLSDESREHHYDAITKFLAAANSQDINVALLVLKNRFTPQNPEEGVLLSQVKQLFGVID